jgi:hypothetical protein
MENVKFRCNYTDTWSRLSPSPELGSLAEGGASEGGGLLSSDAVSQEVAGVYLDYVNAQPRLKDNVSPFVFGEGLYKYHLFEFLDTNELGELHKKANLIYVDYFHKYTTPPPAFASLLSRLGIPKEQATAEWAGFEVFRCSVTNNLVAMPRLRALGCISPAYKWNSVKASVSRLASSFQALLETNTADYLVCLDLTYPEDISKLLLANSEEQFKKIICLSHKCLRTFISKLQKKFFGGDQLCVHFNTHLWKTRNPHEPHLHHHLNIPNCMKNSKGELIRFQPFIRDLATLRLLWFESIVETFGYIAPFDQVNLFVNYISLKNRPRLIHRLKYCSRRPSADFFEHYREDVCPHENFAFVFHLLYYTNPRHHFGWSIGSFPDLKEARSRMVNVCHCPICHARAEKVLVPSFDGFALVFWSSGLWCLKRPPPP